MPFLLVKLKIRMLKETRGSLSFLMPMVLLKVVQPLFWGIVPPVRTAPLWKFAQKVRQKLKRVRSEGKLKVTSVYWEGGKCTMADSMVEDALELKNWN